jgi:hypothetical protein
MMTTDGEEVVSPTVEVRLEHAPVLNLWTKPSLPGVLNLRVDALEEYPLEINVFDLQGRQVFHTALQVPYGTNQYPIETGLGTGVYTWQVTRPDTRELLKTGKVILY